MIAAGQFSTAGIKSQNDDACGILVPKDGTLFTKGVVAVVADGVSSSEAGREAAEACVRGYISDYFSAPDSWTVKTASHRILGALNRWLYGTAQRAYRCDRALLTTLSIAVFKGGLAHVFHVGDTRVYRWRNGTLECLTRDHMIALRGDKPVLARAMGADVNIEIDYRTASVEAGDVFLLTTDGVYQWLPDGLLSAQIALHRDNLERGARAIVELAQARGSDDNLTCQLLRIDEVPKVDEESFYRRLAKLPFPPPLEPGMVLDGYRIVREMHASRRTQVYLAVDTRTDKHVVLKTPSVNYADDPRYIDRFLHEEWVGRRIDNVHVAKIVPADGPRQCLYYVMEHVNGQTLRQWMNDHPAAPLSQVRPIVEQLAKGLRAFHRLDMVHQDIKPENVLIDLDGTVKIVDFGSTKIAGLEETPSPERNEDPLATMGYAAPELFLDSPCTNRSDGYALGVIAYEMLTGKLPYGGALSRKAARSATYIPARTHVESIPPWVDGALRKAVQLSYDRRYESSSEFIYDLSHPNPAFMQQGSVPLLEANPIRFWKMVCLVLLAINVATWLFVSWR